MLNIFNKNNKESRINVLVIDPVVNSKKSKKYEHYNYLFNELSKVCNCFLYSKTNFSDIEEVICFVNRRNFYPDIIYFGMGWFSLNKEVFEKKIIKRNPYKIPIIGFLYKAQNHLNEKLFFLKNNLFNSIVTPLPYFEEYQRITGIKCNLLPNAGDSKIFFDRRLNKIYDIGFSGALHDNDLYDSGSFKTFNIRSRAQEMLRSQKGIKAFLNGSDDIKKRIPTYEEYAIKISQCRIWISTPGPYEEIVERYFEIGMSKTLLFCNEIPKPYKDILIDGFNCIVFKNDMSDFLSKFYFCLKEKKYVDKIIENAFNDFHSKHNYSSRAIKLKSIFENLIKLNHIR